MRQWRRTSARSRKKGSLLWSCSKEPVKPCLRVCLQCRLPKMDLQASSRRCARPKFSDKGRPVEPSPSSPFM